MNWETVLSVLIALAIWNSWNLALRKLGLSCDGKRKGEAKPAQDRPQHTGNAPAIAGSQCWKLGMC
jgi:hypothetical protein